MAITIIGIEVYINQKWSVLSMLVEGLYRDSLMQLLYADSASVLLSLFVKIPTDKILPK